MSAQKNQFLPVLTMIVVFFRRFPLKKKCPAAFTHMSSRETIKASMIDVSVFLTDSHLCLKDYVMFYNGFLPTVMLGLVWSGCHGNLLS